MTSRESAITFSCGGDRLIGILHQPADPGSCGVVVVVGAPQYRVGSHRQYLLLARDLAEQGFPVLRFDYRGMGDSDGDFAGFEAVDDDIHAAIDALCRHVPDLDRIALWGLCDGASAISFFAAKDPRVKDVVLINPWVRTEETLARAEIGGYYAVRLLSKAFWGRLLSGKIDVFRSVADLLGKLRLALARTPAGGASNAAATASLPQRVAASLRAFEGRSLLVLSGRDLTAQEFESAVLSSKAMTAWSRRPEVSIRKLEGANHTYAKQAWRRTVHDWTVEQLRKGETEAA